MKKSKNMNKNIVNKKVLPIVSQVAQTLHKKNLIKSQEKLLLTISGGQDSICLLVIFFLLRTQLLITFDLLFCHHFWQRSSFFTMVHVAKCNFCCSTNIMFFLPLNQLISEKAARDWRQKVIQRLLLFYGYDTGTQAHTKSDRIETILFNLIRGTGLTGAATLQFQHVQSFFSYNKFYPIEGTQKDVFDPSPLKGFCPKPLKTNLINCIPPGSGKLNILHRKKSCFCEIGRTEVNGVFSESVLKASFYKVNKNYALAEAKNINFLLQFLNYLTSSLCFLSHRFALQDLHPVKVGADPLVGYPYGTNLKYIYNYLSISTSPFLHTLLYTYLKTSQFEIFTIIGNEKLLHLVTKHTHKNNKLYFFRLALSQGLAINSFSFKLRICGKTTSSTNVGNKWFSKVTNRPEIKPYKTYYNQLKRLIDLRVMALSP